MAQIAVFHHAQGLTAGVRSFADHLSADGHDVAVPDLFDGSTFESLPEGIAHAERLGFGSVLDRGREAISGRPAHHLHRILDRCIACADAGSDSTGRQGCRPLSRLRPADRVRRTVAGGVPLQIHAMDGDAPFVSCSDLEAARVIVDGTGDAEMYLYPGEQHLFADSSLPAYEPTSAELLAQRVRAFVAEIS